MATSVAISLDQYLHTSYRPDCDYIDGEVQERNLGETEHSDLQTRLVELLLTPESKRYVRATTEPRVQVREARFRIPDVCVRRVSDPKEQFIRRPPLLCIEVLSPEDTLARMMTKLGDYERMGIQTILILDPNGRHFRFTGGKLEPLPAEPFDLPGSACRFDLGEIEKLLD